MNILDVPVQILGKISVCIVGVFRFLVCPVLEFKAVVVCRACCIVGNFCQLVSAVGQCEVVHQSVFLRSGLSHASDSENVSRFVVGGNLFIEAVRVGCKPFPLSVFRCFHAVQSVVGKPVTSCGLFLSCLPADAADVSVVAGCSCSVRIVQLLLEEWTFDGSDPISDVVAISGFQLVRSVSPVGHDSSQGVILIVAHRLLLIVELAMYCIIK